MRRGLVIGWLTLSLAAVPAVVAAQDGGSPGEEVEARTLFQQGIELAREERWAEALELFRRSRAITERPSTVFNVATVLVRLGRAREALRALDDFMRISDATADAQYRGQVPELRQLIESSLSTLVLRLAPPQARVTIDGEAIEGEGAERTVPLDPGRHVVSVSAEGHERSELPVSGTAGSRAEVSVELVPSPAHLSVTSLPSASIAVDGEDVGAGEVSLELAPGEHTVLVTAPDHQSLERTVTLAPGQRFRLDAPLEPDGEDLIASPILWTLIGVVVVGAAVGVGLGFGLSGTAEPYGGTANIFLQP